MPVQKLPPAPVSTIERTSSSASASTQASAIPTSMAELRAFLASGRFMVTTMVRPRRSTVRFSVPAMRTCSTTRRNSGSERGRAPIAAFGPPLPPAQLDANARRLARCADVADLRRVAKRRLPGGVFDYADGAAEDELTRRGNEQGFRDLVFDPRVLRDVSDVDPSMTLLGGGSRYHWCSPRPASPGSSTPKAKLAVALAAARRGIPTRSPPWRPAASKRWPPFPTGRVVPGLCAGGQGLVRELVQRAAAAATSLLLTVDTAVHRRGAQTSPASPCPRRSASGRRRRTLHRGWTCTVHPFGSDRVRQHGRDGAGDRSTAVALADYIDSQFDPSFSWTDLVAGSVSDLPVIIKGVQSVPTPHGRRPTGSKPSPCPTTPGGNSTVPAHRPAHPAVVDAVGDAMAVLCDGGIRRAATSSRRARSVPRRAVGGEGLPLRPRRRRRAGSRSVSPCSTPGPPDPRPPGRGPHQGLRPTSSPGRRRTRPTGRPTG